MKLCPLLCIPLALCAVSCLIPQKAAGAPTLSLPLTARQYRQRGEVALSRRQPRKAIGYFTLALLRVPTDFVSLLDRARAYEATGDDAHAQDDYAQAIALAPRSAAAYFGRGRLRERGGDTQVALADYGLAISLAPQYAPAYIARAALFRALEDYARAAQDDDVLAALHPGPATVRQRAADYEGAKDWAKAADDYEALLQAAPDAALYVRLGYCLLRQGLWKDALDNTQSALRLEPSRADARLQAGLLYALTGKAADAQQQYDLGLPNAATTQINAATDTLVLALQKRPDDPLLLSLLHRLQAAAQKRSPL